MGLTISYGLQFNGQSAQDARELVKRLHQRAAQLPIQKIGPIIERAGKQTTPNFDQEPMGLCWLLIQASHCLKEGSQHHSVSPLHLMAFSVWTGEGAEMLNIGLAKYPATIRTPDGRHLATNTHGWSWSSSCKTQYASNPSLGGIDHFVRVHRTVIELLDAARDLQILDHVCDDGDYWETRDESKLRESVGAHNRLIARIAGKLKDILGDQLASPITEFPNFEHLEADAQPKTP